MGISSGAGTANPSKEPENTPSGVRVARSLVFCAVFCRSLFVLLAIALSVFLRFTTPGIIKLSPTQICTYCHYEFQSVSVVLLIYQSLFSVLHFHFSVYLPLVY
jgi:hypothetical protein